MNLLKEDIRIENMIYEIRGKQVMLDSDLAKLYQCKNGTKEINQAVKNNFKKFPERYSWILNDNESNCLRSKILTPNNHNRGGRRNNIRVFTEQGVAMLSTILKGSIATEISINIMDAFVSMRKYISKDLIEQNKQLINHENRINLLETTFEKFNDKQNYIFFDGQIYDAYSKIIDIMNKANKEVVIIDSYADKKVLDMLCQIKVNIILITTKKLLKQIDIDKYNGQYNNLTIIYNNSFHDRYLILDKEIVYHCGSSLNHIGEKTFSINKLEDKNVIELLINKF